MSSRGYKSHTMTKEQAIAIFNDPKKQENLTDEQYREYMQS